MKKLPMLLLIATILMLSYIAFRGQRSHEVEAKSDLTRLDSAPRIASASPKEAPEVQTTLLHCKVDAPLFDASKQFVSIDSLMVANKLADAYRNPERIISERNKSPESAIAVFQLVSSCFPGVRKSGSSNIQNAGCPAIAVEKIIAIHPIEILEKSAEQGSIDAKIAYMLNAQNAAAQLRRLGTARDDELARGILARAQRYGQEAAREGSKDAMRYMSFAYEQGRFGQRDMQMAYIYSLPLSIEGNSNDVKRALELGAKLGERQRSEAKVAALGCAQVSKPGVLNNPFG